MRAANARIACSCLATHAKLAGRWNQDKDWGATGGKSVVAETDFFRVLSVSQFELSKPLQRSDRTAADCMDE
jgi:hypothetical protein